MRLVSSLLLCCLARPGLAATTPGCAPAIAAAERARSTAPGLLGAIGLVESGRMDPHTRQREPWPWTVTAQGVGTFYGSEAAAAAAVQALQVSGVQSIDVGCMQVNLLHHPDAFRTLHEAFDPVANTLYAARFLAALHTRLGDWMAAAAAYHSLTPAIGARYARLISAVWSGGPVPVQQRPDGIEVVTFADGGQMRIMRDAAAPGERVTGQVPGRVTGYLTGP